MALLATSLFLYLFSSFFLIIKRPNLLINFLYSYLNTCKTKTGCKPFFEVPKIHSLHTRLNILGKQSNRGSGGELTFQSSELNEIEGERYMNG